jgi:hypothetical protein
MAKRELQWAGIAVIRPPEPLTRTDQPDQPPAGGRNAAIQAVFLQTPKRGLGEICRDGWAWQSANPYGFQQKP